MDKATCFSTPHFYAHGNNPQYRHFGALMKYTERLCSLFSDGKMFGRCAILYQAEVDWSGMEYMKEDVLTRLCTEMQVGFDLIPSDVFRKEEGYDCRIEDGRMQIGLGQYDTILIPQYPFVKEECAKALSAFIESKGAVFAVNQAPLILGQEEYAPCTVVTLAELKEALKDRAEAVFSGDAQYLRTLHYRNDTETYMFVNEADTTYRGTVEIPALKHPFVYDAWMDQVHPIDAVEEKEKLKISITIEPRKSLIVFDDGQNHECGPDLSSRMKDCTHRMELFEFERSTCTGLAYPDFEKEKQITVPDVVESEAPKFGGFIRYACAFECTGEEAFLEVNCPLEGVEVFLNGMSLGLQVVPTYRYDLTAALRKGENALEIVSATTLERFVEKKSRVPGKAALEPTNKLGLRAPAVLYWK